MMRANAQLSFEIFPPKDAEGLVRLDATLSALKEFNPCWLSVTCGANGSARGGTERTVRLVRQKGLRAAPHIISVGISRAQLGAQAEYYWAQGIRQVVAIRGDAPNEANRPESPGDFPSAVALVRALRRSHPFEIAVAAYPEVHPRSESALADLEHLKAKLGMGASRAITQFFFEPDVFLRFRDKCHIAGISAPIIPGILPLTHPTRAFELAKRCGTHVPRHLREQVERVAGVPDAEIRFAFEFGAQQLRALRREGVEAFHFYTLNRYELTVALCRDSVKDFNEVPRRTSVVSGTNESHP